MERLDYRSFSRTINRTMRRWWLRYGLYWGGLLLLALVYRYIYCYYLPVTSFAGSGQPSAATVYSLAGGIIELVGWPGVMFIWLLAAQRVNGILDGIFEDSAVPSYGRHLQFRFREGLRQGAIPFLVFAVYNILHTLTLTFGLIARNRGDELAGHYLTRNFFHYFLIPSMEILALGVVMVWLIALLTVGGRRSPAPWLVCGAVYVLPVLAQSARAVAGLGSNTGLPYHTVATSPIAFELPWTFFAGLACLIMLVLFLRWRWVVPAWISLGVLVGGALCGSVNHLLAAGPYVVRIKSWLSTLYFLDWPLHYTPFWLRAHRELGTAKLQVILTQTIDVPTTPGLHYLNLAMYLADNIAWIVLLYWFIHSVLLRPRKMPGPVTAD